MQWTRLIIRKDSNKKEVFQHFTYISSEGRPYSSTKRMRMLLLKCKKQESYLEEFKIQLRRMKLSTNSTCSWERLNSNSIIKGQLVVLMTLLTYLQVHLPKDKLQPQLSLLQLLMGQLLHLRNLQVQLLILSMIGIRILLMLSYLIKLMVQKWLKMLKCHLNLLKSLLTIKKVKFILSLNLVMRLILNNPQNKHHQGELSWSWRRSKITSTGWT